jgi:D-sedoheptulose 7-phosphate isomerase
MDLIKCVDQVINCLSNTNLLEIKDISVALDVARRKDCTVFWAGNGGSMNSCAHMAFDMPKEYRRIHPDTKPLKSIVLGEIGWVTAIANDISYEDVFVEQLKILAKPLDVLFLLSGSGNSPNVIKAAKWAEKKEVLTVSFTGFDGGKLKPLSSLNMN